MICMLKKEKLHQLAEKKQEKEEETNKEWQ
jgi:hypothetical protein